MNMRNIATLAVTGLLAAGLYVSAAFAQTEDPSSGGIVDPETGEITDLLMNDIVNEGFETPASLGNLGTRLSFDEQEGALRVDVDYTSVFNLKKVDLGDKNYSGKTLNYSLRAKTLNFEGQAFLELAVRFKGTTTLFRRGFNSKVFNNSNWKTLRVAYPIRPSEQAEIAYMNVIVEGRGSIWFDDIKLTAAQSSN